MDRDGNGSGKFRPVRAILVFISGRVGAITCFIRAGFEPNFKLSYQDGSGHQIFYIDRAGPGQVQPWKFQLMHTSCAALSIYDLDAPLFCTLTKSAVESSNSQILF